MRFGLWYDFRNPAQWRRPFTELYTETLEQIAWAETLGYESIWVSEHHYVDDGYLPAMFPALAAIAARTTRVAIGTNVLLLPLYDPLHVAEDAAVVDVISGGRLELGLGLGWKPQEFAIFGQRLRERASRFEEGIELLRRLFTEDNASHAGRHFRVDGVSLQPKPTRPMPIYLGANSEPAARRAARIGDGLMALDAETTGWYMHELRRLGHEGSGAVLGSINMVVDRDPERAWAETKDHWLFQANEYRRYAYDERPQDYVPLTDPDELRRRERWHAVDPAGAVALIRDATQGLPVKDLHFWAIPPGGSVKAASERIELFAKEVIPHFR